QNSTFTTGYALTSTALLPGYRGMVNAPAPATVTCCLDGAPRSSDGSPEAAAVSKAPVGLAGSAAASVGVPVPRLSTAVANRAQRSPPPTTRIVQLFLLR